MATQTMFAYRINLETSTLSREEIPIPKPGPDEVLVKVTAAGVCHSDVTMLYHPEVARAPSFNEDGILTMGHEGAGIIAEVGGDVLAKYPELVVGRQVAMLGPNPCDETSCEVCAKDQGNLCGARGWYGLSINGAWAGYVVLRASSTVPVPSNSSIPPGVVAVATDAVLSPYHALKTVGGVRAGQIVVIIGCGGLGQNAVQIAKHCLNAASIVASDIRGESMQLAKESGADYVAHPDNLVQLIMTNNLRVDVVLDLVGSSGTVEIAATLVKRGGKIVIVGVSSNVLQVPVGLAIGKQIQILPSVWGTKSELVEVLDAIAQGKIKPQVETRPFDECPKVVEELRDGKLRSRVALVP